MLNGKVAAGFNAKLFFFPSSYHSDFFTGSFCVTSFEGRTVNSYWLCQRRWKSTRRGGLITNECFGSYFLMFCFGGFSNSCSGGKCEVQSGTHLKSKWSCTQLDMKAHCSDLFTHTRTHLWTLAMETEAAKDTHRDITRQQNTTQRILFGIWDSHAFFIH